MKRNVHNEKRDITVLIIVNNLGRAESEYSISLNTVRCYCQKHNYRLEIVEDTEFRNFCQQENVSKTITQFNFFANGLPEHTLSQNNYFKFEFSKNGVLP